MHKMECVQFCTTNCNCKNKKEWVWRKSWQISKDSQWTINPTWKLADALLPSVEKKKHDKRFFVLFNPRLELWLIGTLLVGVTRKSDVWASRKIQKTCVFCPNISRGTGGWFHYEKSMTWAGLLWHMKQQKPAAAAFFSRAVCDNIN